MKKGMTLIEMIIALVIAAIGLVAVTSFLYASWKDWHIGNEIKGLQEDMNLASLTIKSILEEASSYTLSDMIEGSDPEQYKRINVKYTENGETIWEKEFYPDGNKLIMEDIKNESSDTVINTLQDIKFSDASEEDTTLKNTVKVKIDVSKLGNVLENEFSVKLRN